MTSAYYTLAVIGGSYLFTPAGGGAGPFVTFMGDPVTFMDEPVTHSLSEEDMDILDVLAALTTGFNVGGRLVFDGLDLTISAPDNDVQAGAINIRGGTATDEGGSAGGISITGGASIDGTGGLVLLVGGDSDSGSGGTAIVKGGGSATGNGGEADLLGGSTDDAGAVGGTIVLGCGDAPTTPGDLIFVRLRTTDPANENHAWNHNDIVELSSP